MHNTLWKVLVYLKKIVLKPIKQKACIFLHQTNNYPTPAGENSHSPVLGDVGNFPQATVLAVVWLSSTRGFTDAYWIKLRYRLLQSLKGKIKSMCGHCARHRRDLRNFKIFFDHIVSRKTGTFTLEGARLKRRRYQGTGVPIIMPTWCRAWAPLLHRGTPPSRSTWGLWLGSVRLSHKFCPIFGGNFTVWQLSRK